MTRTAVAVCLLALSSGTGVAAGAEPSPITLEGAHWIWSPAAAPSPAESCPAGVVYFRAGFTVTERSAIQSAELIATADNFFEVHLNGQLVGESAGDPDAWRQPKRFHVAELVKPGQNVIAVGAANTAVGPAGLIVKLQVRLADGQEVTLASDAGWKCIGTEPPNWQQPDCNDQDWLAAREVGDFGANPWGLLPTPAAASPAGRRGSGFGFEPPADYPWPEGILFVGDDCSLYRPSAGTGSSYDSLSVTLFNPRHTRAFPEHDLPAPMKVGHKLFALRPAKPGVSPQLLLDAGAGALGSPTVSFDGRWVYVSMVPAGEAFYHLYRLPAAGGPPQRLTEGPFHDIDPVELPDGRIAFTSTRAGTYDEYHATPSRALFTMTSAGGEIRPLTHTFIFDNEPEVMADGRILFIRSDNFFDRGKVETLLHAVYPDGTRGYTEFGLDLGPEYGVRLRAFDCGSPAPMADGRVAYVTGSSIAIGRPGSLQKDVRHLRMVAGDVAALPDGRLLCTLDQGRGLQKARRGPGFYQIGLVDPQGPEEQKVLIYASETALHSPVFLGPRARPPVLAPLVNEARTTGVLYCQNARFTKNTTAGWPQVRAIRVLAGRGLTLRSSHSYIVHAGSEVVELGTVPLGPDGSFAVEVPADTAIALQAVDAEGRSELNEMSWIYVRPGETRGCVGCHQPRQAAPSAVGLQALRSPPLKLTGRGQPHRFRGNNAAVTGLMELQFDRFREVAGLNRHATTVPLLIAQLQDTNEGQRVSAAQRLAVYRDDTAAPALAERLQDKVREVRVAAAIALATCGTRDSAAALLAAATDRDELVRQAVTIALENLTGRAGAKDLEWEAIEADLVQRLRSPDRDIVRRAAVALGHTGRSEAACAALRDYLIRERDANPYPAWRRAHDGDGARFNSLSEANPRTLQAVARALGAMKDEAATPFLADALARQSDPATGNLFLAEAAAEALGRIGSEEAEQTLIAVFAGLKDYPRFTSWYGDHPALMACHASPLHYYIAEALDALSSTNAGPIIPHLIRSVPTDTDRALMFENDDYETLVGRIIRRSGAETSVVDTCLAMLGDGAATKAAAIEDALRSVQGAWAGRPGPEHRAAQILSLACRDRQYQPRILAALDRYRGLTNTIARVFDHGIPEVKELPVKNWACFFLARALGNLADPASVEALTDILAQSPTEFAAGSPDPLGPGVLFLHNELTPCWRAAVAWALGRIGDPRAAAALLHVVGDLNNAPDTRHAAAEALGQMADDPTRAAMRQLASGYPDIATQRALLDVQEVARIQPTIER